MTSDELEIRTLIDTWHQATRDGDGEQVLKLMTDDVVFMFAGRDMAWCRTHIDVRMTPQGGATTRRTGYALTILRKQTDGRWLLARDANLLTPA